MDFADLYPERRGKEVNPTVLERVGGAGHPSALKARCQNRVIENIEKAPMIRHMLAALKASGCPVDITKNISCEMCHKGYDLQYFGNYDEKYNQIFLCANNIKSFGEHHAVLLRNLFYMYDRCVNKYDFNNVEHLACTEIRKANLANCDWTAYMWTDGANWSVRKEHANCVKLNAFQSLVKTRFVPDDIAKETVDKVFDKCYKDLEPIGRRVKNERDMLLAHDEKFLYGYHPTKAETK
jgi:inner membrane protease ATP23